MSIRGLFRKTVRDERGSFSVEAILMFPMLIWGFMALYVFFEGLRESNINLKATYSVADVLSRETEDITMTYLNNMNTIYEWLARSPDDTKLRVSVVRWDEDSETHSLHWSRGVGVEDMRDEWVAPNITPHVPIMADQAHAIVVETWVNYVPIMDIPILPVGLNDTEIHNIVVTMPRFAGKLDFEGMGDGTGSVHDDSISEDTGGI